MVKKSSELLDRLEEIAGDVEELRRIRDKINEILREPVHVCWPYMCTRPHADWTFTSGISTTWSDGTTPVSLHG